MSYAAGRLTPLVDEGLGNSTYLADPGGGRALAAHAARGGAQDGAEVTGRPLQEGQ